MKRTAAALSAVAALAALSACSSSTDAGSSSKPAATKSSPAPAASKAKPADDLGYPPEPDAATAAAFIKALNAIDPDIVHGKDEKALDRGANTCRTIKDTPDRAKQIDQTNQRWSSPTHPDGHGLATAAKILDAAHKHLCPTF
ncbi:hypothetical protein [Streptomyces sp. NPDC003299]